jgi:peptidoglycan/xylan/chitin deacetylase (PgdA/CDA1 family)
MNATVIIKAGLSLMHYSGAAKLFAASLRGRGSILCLHHVRPASDAAFQPNYQLEITPEFLDAVIEAVKAEGYRLVSLEEAVASLKQAEPPSTPFAAFTLDDGYRDNVEFAAPVFRKHNCPYMIFVAPGIVEATTQLWWRDIELIADRTASSLAQKKAMFADLMSGALRLGEDEQRAFVREKAIAAALDQAAACRSVAMTWDEIRASINDPLCSIGAHTINHFAIKKLAADRALREMIDSKHVIERELNCPIKYFAYPYGAKDHADARDFELAAQAGFEASVTTRKGVITCGYAKHLQALPRVMVSGRYQKPHYVTTLMSGLPLGLNRGFRELDIR